MTAQTTPLFLEDDYTKAFEAEVLACEGNAIVLDQTHFYATSGGQPGDIGLIRLNGEEYAITSTVKDRDNPGRILHIVNENAPVPAIGEVVTGEINWDWRYANMRMHSALHLLCSLIEGDVTGGQIGSAKSRLDFNIDSGTLDKEALTEQFNILIEQDHPITQEWITEEELNANPDLVRTLSVKPPRTGGKIRLIRIGMGDQTVDLQPCGGTHVKTTHEIGRIEVSKIENKGRMNKRISIRFADQ